MGYSEINIWLKSERNFLSGIALLELHEGSAALLSLLRSGENDFTRNKLTTALKTICDRLSAADIPAEHKSKPVPEPKDFQKLSENKRMWIDVANLPDDLKKLWIQKNDITREQGRLHAQLELLPDKEERRKHGERILEIEEERAEIWKKLERFQLHGAEIKTEKQITILDLISERDALGVRISKHGKKPEYAARVEEWKAKKDELHKQILNAAKPL